MNLNKVQLIGRVTRDPEIKALPSGSHVANFGFATNRYWTDRDGGKQEATDFHNLVVFGKLVENVVERYVFKGSLLYVEGRLQTRSWEAEDGSKRYATEVVVENIQLAPRSVNAGERPPRTYEEEQERNQGGSLEDEFNEPPAEAPARRAPARKSTARPAAKGRSTVKYPDDDEIKPEDIPF